MLPNYYSLNEYIKETYGQKLCKLSLSGGMSCPNRDGKIDTKGCIFCSKGGSGDFTGDMILKHKHTNNSILGKNYFVKDHRNHTLDTFHTVDLIDTSDSVDKSDSVNTSESIDTSDSIDTIEKNDLIDHDSSSIITNVNSNPLHEQILLHLDKQIEAAKEYISSKYQGEQYIAYFQSFTNTYADISYLRRLYTKVIKRPDIRILSIATRPDCIDPEILNLLYELNQIKPVWIELGLQTIHESTASYIRRGYPLSVYDQTVKNLQSIGIKPIVHMILGLPGETEDMMVETADYIGKSGAAGIKLQLLHVLKNTDLADDYAAGSFQTMELDSYMHCLGRILETLPPQMVIHRLTGDGPKNLLIAPTWSGDKKRVMNTINHYFKDNNIMQGRNFNEYRSNNSI